MRAKKEKTCYNCFNLKRKHPGLIRCSIDNWEKIYYPQFRGTLTIDFKKFAKDCENYNLSRCLTTNFK